MINHEYREDGMVWFDDNICELADLLLGTEGIRYIYLKKRDRTWIRRIKDDWMRFAVTNMNEKQITILELLIFEDRTVTDIRRVLNLSMTQLRTEIRDMRKTLLAAE